jgi:hypothetical protein
MMQSAGSIPGDVEFVSLPARRSPDRYSHLPVAMVLSVSEETGRNVKLAAHFGLMPRIVSLGASPLHFYVLSRLGPSCTRLLPLHFFQTNIQ